MCVFAQSLDANRLGWIVSDAGEILLRFLVRDISFPLISSHNPETELSDSVDKRLENSKALFGNRDRIVVIEAIARRADDAVNATDLSLELGMLNSRVRAQLLALSEVGLLGHTPPGPGKRWYVRRKSSFWKACLDLIDSWEE